MSLDYETACRAAELVEQLTTRTSNDIDRLKLDEIENICKKSPVYIERVHTLLFHQLKEKHSQIRLNALRICNCLFKKFERFRRLVVVDFSVLLKLTINTDEGRPLPPPKKFATDLELFTVKCIKGWHDEFGKDFKVEFEFVFKYLDKYKKIDYNEIDRIDRLQSLAEAKTKEIKEKRTQGVRKERLDKIESEVNELEPEILIAARTLEGCLELLVPTPEEFSIPAVEENAIPSNSTSELPSTLKTPEPEVDSDDEDAGRRETGVLNIAHSVTVTLKPDFRMRLKKTEDNAAIIESANEQVKLITNKYLPKIKTWLQDVVKWSTFPSSVTPEPSENLMKRIINLKQRLTDLSYRENKIQYYEDGDDCSSDSDMEEVPPASADDLLAQRLVKETAESKLDDDIRNDGNDKGNGSEKVTEATRDGSLRDDALHVPKLPFDVDLYHWEDEKLEAPSILPTNLDGNSFWTSNSVMDTDCDGIIQPGGSMNLRTRVIEFTGKFEKVDRQCRAPLPSGKLCPREDRYKCPFHGRIVPRDELGRVLSPEDEQMIEKQKKSSVPDWQDPQLLKDLERQTGVDLKMPEKGRKRKKKDRIILKDLKKEDDTPRNRLEKKVFKKSSVKRVAKILDGMDQRKHRDKFGDQFNYVHDTA